MECAQKIGYDSTVPEIQCVRQIQHRLSCLPPLTPVTQSRRKEWLYGSREQSDSSVL